MSQADYIEILTLLRKAVKAVRERSTGSPSKQPMAQAVPEKPTSTTSEGVIEISTTSLAPPAIRANRTQEQDRATIVPACGCSHRAASGSKNEVAGSGSNGSSTSTLKQYPLHTKRAQTVSFWLQAMVLVDRETVGNAVEDAKLGVAEVRLCNVIHGASTVNVLTRNVSGNTADYEGGKIGDYRHGISLRKQ